ncbi:hypothetical protein ACOSQ2_029657 [Xanthoceras sorbifolium]
MFPLLLKGIDIETLHCDICKFAKHRRVSFLISNNNITFSLIHSDIWGPSAAPNVYREPWFVSFIDDCTRVTWLFSLKNKSNVNSVFPTFHNMMGLALNDYGQAMLKTIQ